MDLALNSLQRLICHKTQPTMEIPQKEKIKRSYLGKKELFAILLHINPIVTFAINNIKIYNIYL